MLRLTCDILIMKDDFSCGICWWTWKVMDLESNANQPAEELINITHISTTQSFCIDPIRVLTATSVGFTATARWFQL